MGGALPRDADRTEAGGGRIMVPVFRLWPRSVLWSAVALCMLATSSAGLPWVGSARAADYPPSTRDLVEVDPARAGVMDRKREDYLPTGARIGSFLFLPEVLASIAYDDNITASGSNPKADGVVVVRPSAQLRSDWTRHFFSVDGFFESGTYLDYSEADYENYSVGSQARIDITRDASVFGYVRYLHGNELPGDGETDTEIAVPLPFDRLTAGARGDYRFNRLWLSAAMDVEDTSYASWLDGAPTYQDYRDGRVYTASGRIGYDLSPLTSLFLGASHDWSRFADSDFDGSQAAVTAGLKFEPTRLLRGEAFVGYQSWRSVSGALRDVAGLTYGANLAWFASPLLTVTFTGSQTVDGSNYLPPGDLGLVGSSVLTNNAGVRLDYELRRNVLLSAWIAYQNQQYEDYSRRDQKYLYGVEGRYLVSRNWQLALRYTYTDFDSNYDGINGVEDYTRSILTGSISYAY